MRLKTFRVITIIISCFILFFHDSSLNAQILTQVSTINALMTGLYDGSQSLSALKVYGDFGLGTFDCLDGEMIIVDGHFYKMKSDGKIEEPLMKEKVPFAALTKFKSWKSYKSVSETDMQSLERTIDSLTPTANLFYAVRIEGNFRILKARSVPKQQKPYIPLVEVVKKQSEFKFENIEGTIIGFRCPSYVKGINVPGYHFHFISKDRKSGGHVLSFTAKAADVKIAKLNGFRLLLPDDSGFYSATLDTDKEQELKKVEK